MIAEGRHDPRPFRVLITGSRVWSDHEAVDRAIRDALPEAALEVVVVHGACPTGADAIASRWCADNAWWLEHGGVTLIEEPHPANWDTPCRPTCRHGYKTRTDRTPYCPGVGPYRNQDMVDLGADVCLAFLVGDSRGTTDCIRRAAKAGIPVRRFERGLTTEETL